jgi:hypothetical protein
MPETLAGGISTMGVFAHEYGHALGLPDLYDTDYSSQGAGDWSLMSGGSWNGAARIGDRPAHLDAWCKYALGWATPMLIAASQDNITIAPASQSNAVYQFLPGSPASGGEYFLVENRQTTPGSFDYALPGPGLLIWHIDESRNLGNNKNNAFECELGPGAWLWSGLTSAVSIGGIRDSGPLMSFNFSNTSTSPPTTTTTSIDCVNADGDGFGVGTKCAKVDCDDTDPEVNPDAEEVCQDGIDNDCNPDTPDDCREKCFFVSLLGRGSPRLAAVRAFRDETLAATAIGRAAIRLYYRKAELINDAIERNPRCKAALRRLLNLLID